MHVREHLWSVPKTVRRRRIFWPAARQRAVATASEQSQVWQLVLEMKHPVEGTIKRWVFP
jgi:hypothetical protein